MPKLNQLLRSLPAVDKLLIDPLIAAAGALVSPQRQATVIREQLGLYRAELIAALSPEQVSTAKLTERIVAQLEKLKAPKLRAVINATGVVIHTNLGRSPLAAAALEQITLAGTGYCNLEYDLEAGGRGGRGAELNKLLCQLTGASFALVVNNNAAAMLLVLQTLATNRQVIVSRGQLVEIGGSFRIPDIISQSGAQLVEVGCTNKTHPYDYTRAINPATALILETHHSNFYISGFTAAVKLPDLAKLAHNASLPLVYDLGSGALFPELLPAGVNEPSPRSALEAGADIVCFSGDKLLGGPQAGIILCQDEKLHAALASSQLLRALRIDKLAAAALEATLRLYLNPEQAAQQIPSLRMLRESAAVVYQRAKALQQLLPKDQGLEYQLRATRSRAGGGVLPNIWLDSHALAITSCHKTPDQLSVLLRAAQPRPVVGRINNDQLLLDLRTVSDAELPDLALALSNTCQ